MPDLERVISKTGTIPDRAGAGGAGDVQTIWPRSYSSSRTMRAPSVSAFSFIRATMRGRLRKPQSVVR